MTYPDPVYTGPGGDVSAWIRPAAGKPDLVRASGTQVDYLATGNSTGGLFGLYRWSMGPAAGGADPHYHRTISESFYVLTGNVRIFDGTSWLDSGEGDFVHVPPGGIHGFRNESGAAASMLIHFVPGAPRQAYFEGLDLLGGMTAEERAEFLRLHDNHMV